ncbi:hypothetical protein [Melittangium boletus]|uniref:Tetratricopeptide repeat domain protein n=1 Tax=Melittangium boletus DSM 14713 TaxID=1294270 RepID=A0A250IE60_9BACT|nr:hypothetical protein [Melittangium boletus]ATB29417.1 hypothetical protein MEBOL_002866 [Melittangium boletus DSM 14713]
MSRHPGGAVIYLLVILGVTLSPPTYAAERGIRNHLLLIHQFYDASDYERALAQIQVARQERHGTDEDVALSLYEGILLCEMLRKEEGKAAFRTAFLLRPDAKLPEQVSPKIEADAEAIRRQVKRELAEQSPPVARKSLMPESKPSDSMTSSPQIPELTSAPSGARRYALVPALAGGTLAVAGGASWGISRVYLNRLRNPSAQTSVEELQRAASLGDKWQTAGVGLLAVGAVGLVTAAGMYVWGGNEKPSVALGAGPSGASILVQGRWP